MKILDAQVSISDVKINGESFYKISNCNEMPPFFMSIVSDSNHWMFIASNGGLSSGRKNANYALFPYYTSDKITESAEITGSKSIFRIYSNGNVNLWEPLSDRYEGRYEVTRNLYKNIYGNKIIFEEINHDLQLTFRYQWNSSDLFGFVRKSTFTNNSSGEIKVEILDGIQNIMPCGVEGELQNASSNLVDAYKRNELEKETGLGIYALSAIIVDKAEPSEALKANVVWSIGLQNPLYLLSSLQLKGFRKGQSIREETDIKGEKGAYFIHEKILLPPASKKEWMIITEVNQNHAAIARLSETIKKEKQLGEIVEQDIEAGTKRLIELNAASDGLQLTSDKLRDTRHFANTLFNIMRGGIFDNNYKIEKWDFRTYLAKANKKVFASFKNTIEQLPDIFTQTELWAVSNQKDNSDFKRLCLEYMPLKFSRRHGDPSRPWNRFSINSKNETDGSKILDYQGNWRDIFQNWEALSYAYPGFIKSMIHKFLNASTFDGYNPYRVTKDGFDWETIEPDDPWSYIGYWGDHQIIYLLKFLEFIENHAPGSLSEYFDENLFVYANVPYKIKNYEAILKNPKDTIDFDHILDQRIRGSRAEMGADAALISDRNGKICKVNFLEKILAAVLAKLSNLIPEGGIWMNTQRPEWNDANNALVGNGVSMVTLYYLKRFLNFFEHILQSTSLKETGISEELADFFDQIVQVFGKYQHLLSQPINNSHRKLIMDALGGAASDYRLKIYAHSFSGEKRVVSTDNLKKFVKLGLRYLAHSIQANRRSDGLFHAYNLMTLENEKEVSVSYLSEMLEGQVAVLSAGYLSANEALTVLDSLKNSKLFREDQYSYILYPNKELPGFLLKNRISEKAVASSKLLKQLVLKGNVQLVEKDVKGHYHFNGNFRNAADVRIVLDQMEKTEYAPLVKEDKNLVLQIFEEVFNHKAFTGRSGTFYGYEGLGSIYWHMVSKLQLAVQECCLKAIEDKESEEVIGRLLEHYYEINEGIGIHKSPQLYGAFPTDPYSHTPAGRGAQQPGMTGQVKEDILCRFGELGVFVKKGQLYFNPCLLRRNEFLTAPQVFEYIDVHTRHKQLHLAKGMLCFTYCQIPVVYQLSEDNSLEVSFENNEVKQFNSLSIDTQTSQEIFNRTGNIVQITVRIKETGLR